ncbi:hypothetical protein ElyMa_000516600 [Elysia marginata]|uniref:Uncharacterized protein n=1 Tax=Elysia marginata TaxID=1093978 RepID=A0AAV4FZE8_9GAST|nr:hypothetical protein ElyMa_000516600 [Elysia marginata]
MAPLHLNCTHFQGSVVTPSATSTTKMAPLHLYCTHFRGSVVTPSTYNHREKEDSREGQGSRSVFTSGQRTLQSLLSHPCQAHPLVSDVLSEKKIKEEKIRVCFVQKHV